MALDLSKIQSVDFPVDQYVAIATEKKQIVLHHTVSGKGIKGDVSHWVNTTSRVATSLIIDRKGVIHQCFSTKYWAHHIGMKGRVINELGTSKSNVELNNSSIGIELDSYGGLIKKDGKFVTVYGNEIDKKDVVEYKEKYRGYSAYEKYTEAQLATLKELLDFLCEKWSIPSKYNADMFDVSKNALNGVPGIWSHTSYRSDKSDVHPQSELIAALGGEKKESKPKAPVKPKKKDKAPAKKAPAKPKPKKDAKAKGVKK